MPGLASAARRAKRQLLKAQIAGLSLQARALLALCGHGFGEVQLKSLEAESKEMGEQKEAREHVFVKGLASKRP